MEVVDILIRVRSSELRLNHSDESLDEWVKAQQNGFHAHKVQAVSAFDQTISVQFVEVPLGSLIGAATRRQRGFLCDSAEGRLAAFPINVVIESEPVVGDTFYPPQINRYSAQSELRRCTKPVTLGNDRYDDVTAPNAEADSQTEASIWAANRIIPTVFTGGWLSPRRQKGLL